MVSRRVRGFMVALAVLVNVAGGPVAFAHGTVTERLTPAPIAAQPSVNSESAAGAPAAAVSEHCAGHAKSSPPDAPPVPAEEGGNSCCASGHCVCVAASTFHATSATVLVRFARFLPADELRLNDPRSAAPSDPLRPPIV